MYGRNFVFSFKKKKKEKSKYLQSSVQPPSLTKTPEQFNNNSNEKQLQMHENKLSVVFIGGGVAAAARGCEQALYHAMDKHAPSVGEGEDSGSSKFKLAFTVVFHNFLQPCFPFRYLLVKKTPCPMLILYFL